MTDYEATLGPTARAFDLGGQQNERVGQTPDGAWLRTFDYERGRIELDEAGFRCVRAHPQFPAQTVVIPPAVLNEVARREAGGEPIGTWEGSMVNVGYQAHSFAGAGDIVFDRVTGALAEPYDRLAQVLSPAFELGALQSEGVQQVGGSTTRILSFERGTGVVGSDGRLTLHRAHPRFPLQEAIVPAAVVEAVLARHRRGEPTGTWQGSMVNLGYQGHEFDGAPGITYDVVGGFVVA